MPLRHSLTLSIALAALTMAAAGGLAAARTPARIPPYIAASVADAARPAEDKARDAERKPAETLAFAGIKPGQQVIELFPGHGYVTRLLSKVVGGKGKVIATSPAPRPNAPPGAPDFSAASRALAATPGYGNIEIATLKDGVVAASAPVDVVWTSQNYHDAHNMANADLLALNKSVFNALKPGGVYVIIDHAAEPGSGARDTSTLHRIDEALVRKEVLDAGFRLAGESDLLRNPADGHTAKVFDPEIRGKTDQFLLKFVRPK